MSANLLVSCLNHYTSIGLTRALPTTGPSDSKKRKWESRLLPSSRTELGSQDGKPEVRCVRKADQAQWRGGGGEAAAAAARDDAGSDLARNQAVGEQHGMIFKLKVGLDCETRRDICGLCTLFKSVVRLFKNFKLNISVIDP